MPEQTEIIKKVLSSKIVNKFSKSNRVVETIAVEVIEYNGTKVIQLTKDKVAYGNRPAKRTIMTIDPKNEELKKLISEAYKI